jgi:dTDP-4-amino-4,6-dideoxygalactose transaminase
MKEIWQSQWLTNNGPKHQNLEQLLKQHLEAKNITLFSNGTLALLIAIKALELKGEIITTPFTFAATATSISWMGLKPVFCDIDEKTMCIDADKIEALITKDTSAIMPVHVYGNACNVEKIDAIAKKYNLKVIYDAAHAFGVKHNGLPIGNYGDVSMFSFHATKLFNTIEGGCLTFNNPSLKEKFNLLKNFGIKNEDEIVEIGINAKLNEIQSAIGIINLNLISKEREKREKIKTIYDKNLAKIRGVILNNNLSEKNSLQYYPIRIDENIYGKSRDELYQHLKNLNINARKYFCPLLSNTEIYKDNISTNTENLSVANKISKQILCLPFYGDLKTSQAKMICDTIKSFKS